MKNSKIEIVPNEQGTIIRESSNKDIHFVRLHSILYQGCK